MLKTHLWFLIGWHAPMKECELLTRGHHPGILAETHLKEILKTSSQKEDLHPLSMRKLTRSPTISSISQGPLFPG